MTSLTVTIPLPPNAVKPNARSFWAKKSKATKTYRQQAWAAAKQALHRQTPPMWAKAKMEVKAYFPTASHQDPTNLMASIKAAEDGIQDAGIIANDKCLWPERPQIFKDANNPRIELTITPEV